ncbi:MAG: hypothetical protein A2Y98_01020 [Candidatus Portnoybacteria bacterium RBG_19FT_COMBO_36_7]|uniref:DUF5667 domain-containing protein n=1 Tax=Candidatus Portnoybacteria bacterium RBG_19FT_COMBO_36_7 TaxID=1801992 RepID=A0A1G2F8Z6_9BACT|nr:MAG: hypothetical protein A2Y98_01020 [Candidatus Portnoybacteria bacterium RBG_19FT_COMBO_36_7]
MKKWGFLGICLLILATILFGRPDTSNRQPIENLDQALEKETKICREFKENNVLIKRYIFAMLVLTKIDEKKCLELAQLIICVQKAEKLIDQSSEQLQGGILHEMLPEKLIKIKNDLKKANALHKEVLNGLAAFLSPPPKPLLLIET